MNKAKDENSETSKKAADQQNQLEIFSSRVESLEKKIEFQNQINKELQERSEKLASSENLLKARLLH